MNEDDMYCEYCGIDYRKEPVCNNCLEQSKEDCIDAWLKMLDKDDI